MTVSKSGVSTVGKAARLFFSHLFFVSFAFFIYHFLSYYQWFLTADTKRVFAQAYVIYLAVAPLYYLAAFKIGWLTEKDIEVSKSTLMLRYLRRLPGLFADYVTRAPRELMRPPHMDFETKTAFLALAVKMFFIPIMTNFIFIHIHNLEGYFRAVPHGIPLQNFIFDWLYFVIYNLIFVVDISIFIFAYAAEAKWLGNRIKSVEPTFLGWVVALACYPPLNNVVGDYFLIGNHPNLVITSFFTLAVFKCLIILFFGLYMWASISLMFRAGNLVNRGIVSSGAYGIVRHPAYICKCLAWWFEKTPYILFDFRAMFFLVIWNAIYFFRAMTEERHLGQDPDYQEYVKKVPYRFIPGIF